MYTFLPTPSYPSWILHSDTAVNNPFFAPSSCLSTSIALFTHPKASSCLLFCSVPFPISFLDDQHLLSTQVTVLPLVSGVSYSPHGPQGSFPSVLFSAFLRLYSLMRWGCCSSSCHGSTSPHQTCDCLEVPSYWELHLSSLGFTSQLLSLMVCALSSFCQSFITIMIPVVINL